ANGKQTGIKISYSPLNVSFHGEVWTPNRSNSPDQNYFSLLEFLQGKKQAKSTFSLSLIPSAQAQNPPRNTDVGEETLASGILGRAAGFVAGSIATIVLITTAPAWVPAGLGVLGAYALGIGGGAAIGAYFGHKSGAAKDKEERDLVCKILSGDFDMHCG